jgi:hypothetical protein
MLLMAMMRALWFCFLYILVSRTIDVSGLAGVAAAGRNFQCLLGRKPASRAVAWAIQKSANAGVRPFDLALQAVKGLSKETAGLFRMVSASTTKVVAARRAGRIGALARP